MTYVLFVTLRAGEDALTRAARAPCPPSTADVAASALPPPAWAAAPMARPSPIADSYVALSDASSVATGGVRSEAAGLEELPEGAVLPGPCCSAVHAAAATCEGRAMARDLG